MVCANSPNCFCARTRADTCNQAAAFAVRQILMGEEAMQRAAFSMVGKRTRPSKDFCRFPRIINGKMHYFTLKQYRRQRDKAFRVKPWPKYPMLAKARENALGRKRCAKELIDWKVDQLEQDWAYWLAEEIVMWEPQVGEGLHWKPVESS